MVAHDYAMTYSCLMVAPFLFLAVQIQSGAAEANYTGRDETLQISLPTSLASSNASEVEIIDATVHVPLPLWIEQPLMPSLLATVIGLLGTIFFVFILLMVCFLGLARGGFKRNWHVLYLAPVALVPCAVPELGVDRMRMEVIIGLQMQYVFFGIACLYGWLRGVHHLPGSLALLALPWIARNLVLNCLWTCCKTQEYAPVSTSNEKGCCSRALAKVNTAGAIAFGKLENLDAVSDGLAVASAYFVTDEVQARFAASFTSSTGALGWLCQHLGIGNMMLAALLYGTLVQGSLALWQLPTGTFSLLADLGGFAEVTHLAVTAANEQVKTLMVALGRVCSEGMVQALLQTSLVMAQGQSLFEQPVLAFSISLSCATLAGKAAGMIKNACLALWEGGRDGPSTAIVSSCAALATLAVLAVVLLKLYASQSCESRLWGLTTGCVALA